jgi:hypothetical protein
LPMYSKQDVDGELLDEDRLHGEGRVMDIVRGRNAT